MVSDDEAFIRAILANPGEDAPRLIYANWLEERGDLRAGLLRCEAKWNRLHHLTRESESAVLRQNPSSLQPSLTIYVIFCTL